MKFLNMKFNKILLGTITLFISSIVFAGNEDRAGSAGASELLINPWAASNGMANANTADVDGLEAVYLNVAGLAFSDKIEIGFAHTNFLAGSNTNINLGAFASKISESDVIAISIMSMSFGDINITTTDQPEGGLGVISPKYSNFALSYAHIFSPSISGGLTVKMINQNIFNAKASGFAFDAGLRYMTGGENNDKLKFGITLRNVGSPMRYSGDGYSVLSSFGDRNDDETFTTQTRSASFELPTLLSIGLSYDFDLNEMSKIVTAFNFNANSFTRDDYSLGVRYNVKVKRAEFNAKIGYTFVKSVFDEIGPRATALTGLSAGFSLDYMIGKDASASSDDKTSFGFDYAYQTSNPFNGVHSIGVRLGIN